MSAPGLVWESGVADEIKAGAKVTFVALGTEELDLPTSNDVVAWFVFFDMPDGERKILVKRFVYEPRIFKTYDGLATFVREHLSDWTSVTLPLLPQVRSMKEGWALIQASGSAPGSRPFPKPTAVPLPEAAPAPPRPKGKVGRPRKPKP